LKIKECVVKMNVITDEICVCTACPRQCRGCLFVNA